MTLDDIRGLKDPRVQEICPFVDGVPGNTPAMVLYVPGRIELLGKHTDYAGGISLTCASTRGMVAVVYRVRERAVVLEDVVSGQTGRLLMDDGAAPKGWAAYGHAAMRRTLKQTDRASHGIRIVFASDIPRAAGMSSSSALVTLCALGMYLIPEVSEARMVTRPEDLAGFLGAVESGAAFAGIHADAGVGTRGGSQDHTAVLMGQDGMASLFGYHPVQRLAQLAWPDDMHLLIGVSGVSAPKRTRALAAYNAASTLAQRLGAAWGLAYPGDEPLLGAALESDLFDEAAMIQLIDDIATDPDDRSALWHRFAQFHDECSVVIPSALDAWESADWVAFGTHVARSQELAETWLGNQVPETSALVRLARESGAVAASAFGAGYGGSVWAMAPAERSVELLKSWESAYDALFPDHAVKAHFFRDRPSPGAHVIGGPPLLESLLS